jgi:hypothetical protein
MRDRDVREAIRRKLAADYASDPDTRIVEEMGIWSGSVRIDVAVINGDLTGYELKSDRDTLQRLPTQAELYSRVFDRICLVVGSRHEGKARRIVPRWWGVILATQYNDGVELRTVREPQLNPKRQPLSWAQLLWRDEALGILDRRNLARGVRSKPVGDIHRRLAASIPLDDLSHEVRAVLKGRLGWLGQPVSDQRQVTVDAILDPRLAITGVDDQASDALNARIAPTVS